MLTRQDILIGTAMAAAGIGIVGLMAYPIISPRQMAERAASASSSTRAAFERRWPALPPPLPEPPALAKANRVTPVPEVGNAKPWRPLAALQEKIEQERERQLFEDETASTAAPDHNRTAQRSHAEEPRELCASHGMRRHYFHTHHGRHLSWRCVRARNLSALPGFVIHLA